MSPERLAEIAARAVAAEDGWHVVPVEDDPHHFEIHGDGPTLVAAFGGDSYPVRENAQFAAAARRDVPELLAEVERLRSLLHDVQRIARTRIAEAKGRIAELEAVADAADPTAAIRATVRDFDFSNYGLDDVDPRSEYAEWVGDLASAIAGAISATAEAGDPR